jgi:hypothetical protein
MRKFFIFLWLVMCAVAMAQPEFKVADVQFVAPSSWSSETPASNMRAAQWSIHPLRKSEAAGEVVVFYFGLGQGGDAEANIQRWLGTMTTPKGGPVNGDVQKRTVNGLKVTEVTAYGTYASGMPMAGVPPVPKLNFGLVGAVIEGPQGNLFVRMTGPDRLVKAELPSFQKFIDSAKTAK